MVPTYDWQFFTPHFKKVTGIKKLHHLRFTSASPGCAFVKERAGSEEVKQCFFKKDAENWEPEPDQLPPVLPPAGLSLQRQWYLHDKFCPDNVKDITCPKPAGEAEGNTQSSPSPSPTPPPTLSSTVPPTLSHIPPPAPNTEEPPAKRARLCGHCRKPGHNARRCRSNT